MAEITAIAYTCNSSKTKQQRSALSEVISDILSMVFGKGWLVAVAVVQL